MDKHIVISGGAGFIGSHLAREFLHLGAQVTVLDNLSTGLRENVPKGARFVEHDIIHPWPALPEKVDAVFHLAAQSSGERSFYNATLDAESNVVGTTQCMEYCRTHGVNRVINASTMSVYGSPQQELVDEDCPAVPLSIYGITKLAAERLMHLLSLHYRVAATSFRLFSVYGPGQNLGNLQQGIVSIYLAHLMCEGRILVKGTLDRFRDLVYIDDVVKAFLLSLDMPSSHGEVLNLGTGLPTSVGQMVDGIRGEMGLPDAPLELAASTPGDTRGIVASTKKLERVLGWRPETSFSEGIRSMVKFYVDGRK